MEDLMAVVTDFTETKNTPRTGADTTAAATKKQSKTKREEKAVVD